MTHVSGSGDTATIPGDLVHRLSAAGHVAVLTGAGISAESGVPTFREAQTGLWARYRAEELATPEAFERNPKLVWEWYSWRRGLVERAQPNRGHLALTQLARHFERFTLATQNVDGLHQRAGSANVIELHGNIGRVKCAREGRVVEAFDATGTPPRCAHCSAFLRPDVVWFGEALPTTALAAAQVAAESCDVFLSVGTSALVYPAADLPFIAARAGALVVEVNPDPTPLTPHADFALAGAAGVVLPRLLAALESSPGS